MKFAISAIPLLSVVALVGVGCNNDKPKQSSALDVRPVQTTTPTYNNGYQPAAGMPAYQPVYQSAPTRTAPPQPVVVEPVVVAPVEPAKPAAESYTVQKGDTLFKIAKNHYGDGNKWKKIADANPGLSPSSIKVGQKLVIPQ